MQCLIGSRYESGMYGVYPPLPVIVGIMAGDCSKKYTLHELISIACADDFAVAMFADMTISGFNLVPDIFVKTESVAMLDRAMAKCWCIRVEQMIFICS